MRHIVLRTGLGALFGLLFALVPAGLQGQGVTTSAMSGRITDQNSQPLASAQVTVTDPQSGTSSGALTDANGRYYVPYLRPGLYTVEASSIGHRTVRREGVRVVLGQDQRVDFTLAEEAVQLQGIEVTAESNPTFSPTKTGAQTIITGEDLQNIPSLSRNFVDLAVISPLVQSTGDASSVGGQNNRFNNIQIDGAVNNDVFGLAASGLPGGQGNGKAISLEVIKEYQVLVAPFDVRQAGFTGGLINAVTKSGTNDFTGSAYLYFRNESFVGDLTYKNQDYSADQFKDAQFGFTLGGPIQKDRLHFFIGAELERRNRPTLDNIDSGAAADIGVSPDSVMRFAEILQNQYGVEPGTPNRYTLDNPLNNLFGRLDWQLGSSSRFTIRDSYNTANDDDSPSRGFYYDLSSYTYLFKNNTNSLVGELYSQLGGDLFNNLRLNWERVRDRRNPLVSYGQLRVSNVSDLGGGTTRFGYIEGGAEYFSQGNELDQDIFELTDNLTATRGDHRLTLGTSNQYFHFRNLFFPGSYGRWYFDSLADLEANTPSYYEISLPFPGLTDPAARFGVLQLGAYVQDEWTVNPQLTLTYGLRVDVPFMLDDPHENATFFQATGRHTSNMPSGNPLWSPRLGFNWRAPITSTYRTQIRGGAGIFSGRPPYVWLSNAYGNTGQETVLLRCFDENAPGFSASAPSTCADGSGVTNPSSGRLVNIFASDFKFPQDVKVSLAVDQDLPWDLVGTLEGLYTKSINSIFLQDINIPTTPVADPGSRLGIGDRPIYGTPTSSGFAPVRNFTDFDQVVEGVNRTKPYSYAVVAELRKQFGELLNLRTSYTYQRAYDQQSLTSSIATSNFGFNPVRDYPNDPDVTVSDFDRPNKVVVSAILHLFPQYGGTNLSATYVGQSGRPYSYVYNGDVNGDGYPGVGVAGGRTNDLVYVPANDSDVVTASASDLTLLNEAITLDPCLSDARGRILERNACRGPWTNTLTVRLEQGVSTGMGKAKVSLDIFNFLNLLNRDWGIQEGALFNTANLLSLNGRDANGDLVFRYNGSTRTDDAGNAHAKLPYTTFYPSSSWQMQLGVRYSF